jgi:hypothetical protein
VTNNVAGGMSINVSRSCAYDKLVSSQTGSVAALLNSSQSMKRSESIVGAQ